MLAACSGTAAEPVPEPDPVNRLVVLGADGNVATMAPDGTDRVELTSDGGNAFVYFQPIWSPDATKVAFGAGGSGSLGIVIAPTDGSAPSRTATDTFPFFYYWNDAGDRLALLRNGEPGSLAMEVVFDGTAEQLDTGAPFYFSWEPGGSRLVWHVSTDRLEVFDPADGATVLAEGAGAFQAPDWTPAGVFYTVGDDTEQTLFLSEVGQGEAAPLARIRGFAVFSADPSGSRVAVQGSADAPDAVSAALQQIPRVPFNSLAVIDVASGTLERISDEPALGFFWSPDGTTLLFLTGGDQPATVQWHTWQDGVTTELATFTPSPTFLRDLLPFFDQYAQSMTLWSPDSTQFAFPGVVGDERGIWVQPVDGSSLDRVADGVFVAWSPI